MKFSFLSIFIIPSILFSSSIGILPMPQSIHEKSGLFKVTSSTKIVLGSDTHAEQFIASLLTEEIETLRESAPKVVAENSVRKLTSNFIYIGKPTTEYGKKLLKERKGKLNPEMKQEGYFLDVDAKGIVIIAESDKGLMYGVMSLLQMLETEKRSIVVRGATIHDYPAMKMRGITDDISRGQVSTLENFKKIIRFCARYKMNVYSPYIEDVFQFKKHPEIGKNRGALTAVECKELDAYAKKYFIEIIPIFETLGHWENILIQSDYSKYAEFPGAQTVNVSDERVYALLDEMIGEIAACFSSPYFNIAADESWDVGLGANKARVKKSTLADVHADHYKRVFEIVKKHGKKAMMYGDIILQHPDILKKIPKDVTMVDWQYGTGFDFSSPEIFREAGFPFIVSPAVWNFTGPFPNYINAFLNIRNLSLDGYRNGAMGMVCSNWNDFGGEEFRELNYYGYAWSAECAWNPPGADQEEFNKKFFRDFFATDNTEHLRAVYALLGSQSNQYHWYELWRHPLLPNRDDMIWEKRTHLIERMQSIQSTMPLVLELIDRSSKEIKQNNDQLRYLAYVAKMNLWFAQKYETQERVKMLMADTVKSKPLNTQEIFRLCRSVVDSLEIVRTEFERLWPRTNKPDGLSLLLARYNRQIAYWNEIAGEAERGFVNADPTIKSQWLYHPNTYPGEADSLHFPKAYFRKTYSMGTEVAAGKVQLLGDTWAKLFVNGKLVGEVAARSSLSLTVENQRAKIFDITSFLTDSINVLAVEAQSFEKNGFAGMNLFGEIVYKDGSRSAIVTDNTWQVSDTVSVNWNTIPFNAHSWKSASEKKYPVPVVAPDLKNGRTSWFER
ncbi:MAG: glycoside hydrolase family 20 zincin-like fold domain-containing protein [Bacteroidota bacterium]